MIAARIGGLPEQVMAGRTGLLFTPGDAEELAEQMELLLNHPEWRREMGIQARAMVMSQWAPTTHYHDLMNIYQRLVALR